MSQGSVPWGLHGEGPASQQQPSLSCAGWWLPATLMEGPFPEGQGAVGDPHTASDDLVEEYFLLKSNVLKVLVTVLIEVRTSMKQPSLVTRCQPGGLYSWALEPWAWGGDWVVQAGSPARPSGGSTSLPCPQALPLQSQVEMPIFSTGDQRQVSEPLVPVVLQNKWVLEKRHY